MLMRIEWHRRGQVGSANLTKGPTTNLTMRPLVRFQGERGMDVVRNQDKNLTNQKAVFMPKTSAMVRLVRSRNTPQRKPMGVRVHHPVSGRGS
jgi:hypothetical protein